MDEVRESLNQIQDRVPAIIGALAILIIGWIVAAILGRVVTAAIRRSGLDDRVNEKMRGGQQGGQQTDVARMVGRIVYYLVLLIVLVAALDALGLQVVTQPLNEILDGILGFLPNLIGAAILVLVAWIVATIVRAVVTGALQAMRFDERVGSGSQEGEESAPAAQGGTTPPVRGGEAQTSLSSSIGEAAYWLVFLFFLPAILSALDLQGLLVPVQNLVDKVLGFLPNLLAAALIGLIGWFVARLVGRIVTNLLAALGVDRLGERLGMGGLRLSSIAGTLVYALILLPVLAAALDALQLGAVTQPVSEMLDEILAAIPNILVAALILIIAFFLGRILAGIVADILTGLGFNAVPERLGLGSGTIGGRTPSGLVGLFIQVAIIWFAVIQALEVLGFDQLTVLAADLIELGGHILLGLIIFAIGLILARAAASAIRGSGVTNAGLLAFAAQAAILVLAGAMALRQMGVADEIISLAFTLLIGAIAVAVAIAFGVGGREVAGRELDRWVSSIRGGEAGASGGGASPQTGRRRQPGGQETPPSTESTS